MLKKTTRMTVCVERDCSAEVAKHDEKDDLG